MQLFRRASVLLLVVLATAAFVLRPAGAVEPNEILQDPKLEARARALSAELRCLVCQNQSIDDSNAPLARDLRLLVRERLQAGESDSDVMRFIVTRYGSFVLLRPPVDRSTALLWAAPLLILVTAVGLLWRRMRRMSANVAMPDALSAEELRRLAELDKR